MGRKRIPEEEKRKIVSISMKPETKKLLDYLSKNLDMDSSKVIKYLLEQAGKDQVLRNIVKNRQVADLRAKNEIPAESTTGTGYITIRRKDGSLFTYYKDPNITVDQKREHYNTKEISDKEIDKALAELYELDEERRKYKPQPLPRWEDEQMDPEMEEMILRQRKEQEEYYNEHIQK